MTIGTVLWVDFPARGGHAQAGRRPAIVVQDAAASDRLPTVLTVPLTSRMDAMRFPGTVLVQPDPTNGLTKPSIALVFQLVAIDRRYLSAPAGEVSGRVIEDIWESLDMLTGRRIS